MVKLMDTMIIIIIITILYKEEVEKQEVEVFMVEDFIEEEEILEEEDIHIENLEDILLTINLDLEMIIIKLTDILKIIIFLNK